MFFDVCIRYILFTLIFFYFIGRYNNVGQNHFLSEKYTGKETQTEIIKAAVKKWGSLNDFKLKWIHKIPRLITKYKSISK